MGKPDKNYIEIGADNHNVGLLEFAVIEPPDSSYADALKGSNSRHGTIRGKKIFGGYEDCCDLNRTCLNLDIHFDEWEPRGKFVVTVKGDSDDCRFSGMILKHASEVDIDIGNGSEQASGRSTGTRLNMWMRDGSKVRVRVLHGWNPVFENGVGNYIVNDTWKGIFIHVWKIARWFGLG